MLFSTRFGFMKTRLVARHSLWPNLVRKVLARSRPWTNPICFPGFLLPAFTGMAFLFSGCVTNKSSTAKRTGAWGTTEPGSCKFGTVTLVEDSRPASFSFQKAKGKLGSAKEAIWESAEMGLSGPGAGVIATGFVLGADPDWEISGGDPIWGVAFAGAVGGVAAAGAALAGPVVGAEGLIRSWKTVSPAELARCEAALTNALREMATQRPFHAALLQSGVEKIRGGFLSPEAENPFAETTRDSADAVLEARVDELRLERAGSSEGSYCLRIKTHVRLIRSADGSVCHESRAEYRSGTALFLDWTLRGAIQGVAETGYRALAQYYVNQLLIGPPATHK